MKTESWSIFPSHLKNYYRKRSNWISIHYYELQQGQKIPHLDDRTSSIVFHTHEIPPVTHDDQDGFTPEDITLDTEHELINRLNWL